MALKNNISETPETLAKTYLSRFSKERFTWETMERERMAKIFKSCIESNHLKPDTKQKVLEVLAQNFC
jgi:hypothetical protein